MEEGIQMSSSPTTVWLWLSFCFFSCCSVLDWRAGVRLWFAGRHLERSEKTMWWNNDWNYTQTTPLSSPRSSFCEILMPKQVSGLWFHGFSGLSHMSHFLVDWARSWIKFRTVCYIKFWDAVAGSALGGDSAGVCFTRPNSQTSDTQSAIPHFIRVRMVRLAKERAERGKEDWRHVSSSAWGTLRGPRREKWKANYVDMIQQESQKLDGWWIGWWGGNGKKVWVSTSMEKKRKKGMRRLEEEDGNPSQKLHRCSVCVWKSREVCGNNCNGPSAFTNFLSFFFYIPGV